MQLMEFVDSLFDDVYRVKSCTDVQRNLPFSVSAKSKTSLGRVAVMNAGVINKQLRVKNKECPVGFFAQLFKVGLRFSNESAPLMCQTLHRSTPVPKRTV